MTWLGSAMVRAGARHPSRVTEHGVRQEQDPDAASEQHPPCVTSRRFVERRHPEPERAGSHVPVDEDDAADLKFAWASARTGPKQVAIDTPPRTTTARKVTDTRATGCGCRRQIVRGERLMRSPHVARYIEMMISAAALDAGFTLDVISLTGSRHAAESEAWTAVRVSTSVVERRPSISHWRSAAAPQRPRVGTD
jgi:hypothetical protein